MFQGKVIVYADGGCHNNGAANAHGYGSIKFYAVQNDQVISTIVRRFDYPQHKTNNGAEFQIIIDALEILQAKAEGERIAYTVQVFSDSALVINGINGSFTIKADHLLPLLYDIHNRMQQFEHITFEHVKRDLMVRELGH